MTKTTKKLKSVMLLDDNLATNFLHKKFFEKSGRASQILEFRSGTNALNYLGQEGIAQPDILMVDINMPIMDAWEFLDNYDKLSRAKKSNNTSVILLSTSLSPADKEKADNIPMIKEIVLKPLTMDVIQRIMTA